MHFQDSKDILKVQRVPHKALFSVQGKVVSEMEEGKLYSKLLKLLIEKSSIAPFSLQISLPLHFKLLLKQWWRAGSWSLDQSCTRHFGEP